jgi:hypothetical protein
MMEIQPRDLEILRYCYEQQFLTLEQFKTLFQASKTAVNRRLRKLLESDLLRKDFNSQWGSEPILRLTRNGYHLARKNHPLPEMGYPKLNLSCLYHDALVTSVRLRLQSFWNAHFVPERAIKSNQTAFEIPDGIFYFPSGKGIAVEVENSNKGRFRLIKLMDRWKNQPHIAAVLYVASNESLYRNIFQIIQEASLLPNTLVGVVSWEKLKIDKPYVATRVGDADLFSSQEVF